MVKAWSPRIPRVRNKFRPVWINILEFMYTSDKDDFESKELFAEIKKNFHDIAYASMRNACGNVRAYLLENGIVSCRKIPCRVASAGANQMLMSLVNRDRIPLVLKLIPPVETKPTMADNPAPAAAVQAQLEDYLPAITYAKVQKDKDFIIIGLCKRDRESRKEIADLKKEIAELIDERSARLALVHESSMKANEDARKLANASRLPEEEIAYLKEIGILSEDEDEEDKE